MGIPMDSPTYPTHYSGIEQTVGSKTLGWYTWGFQWTIPPIQQDTEQIEHVAWI